MTWILVNDDGNESDPFESRAEAEDQKQSLEQLGATINLREVGDASESEDEDVSGDRDCDDSITTSQSIQEDDDVDAELIEMSGGDGGKSTDTDDDEDLEIIGDGGRPFVYCRNCNRLSTCAYRCPDDRCGADLAGKPFYRGDDE